MDGTEGTGVLRAGALRLGVAGAASTAGAGAGAGAGAAARLALARGLGAGSSEAEGSAALAAATLTFLTAVEVRLRREEVTALTALTAFLSGDFSDFINAKQGKTAGSDNLERRKFKAIRDGAQSESGCARGRFGY